MDNGFPSVPAAASSIIPNFKVILLGEVGVGKTCWFARARDSKVPFRENPSPSVELDCFTRTVTTTRGTVMLTVWDTAGVERFRTLTRNYYRNSHAALLTFSMEDPSSLFYLSNWERAVMESAPDAVSFLIGNKSDLDRLVTRESIQGFASAHNCQSAFISSAKTGEGVEEALTGVGQYLLDKYRKNDSLSDQDRLWKEGSGIYVHGRINSNNNNEHIKKCC